MTSLLKLNNSSIIMKQMIGSSKRFTINNYYNYNNDSLLFFLAQMRVAGYASTASSKRKFYF
jgi:hypothetical protein